MRFSLLEVSATERLNPHMVRVTLRGDELAGFVPVAPDQQCKLFFGKPGQGPPSVVPQMNRDGDVTRWYQAFLAIPEERRPWMRTFTIRYSRPERREVDIDFVLHDDEAAGPASTWAGSAAPGDVIGMIGPAVSRFRDPSGQRTWLLVGDETALPAIGAFVESFRAGTRALVYAEVAGADDEQVWPSAADVEVRWLHRESTGVLDALRAADLPVADVFAWVAGEASMVRAVRRHLVSERGFDRRAVSFTGYWRRNLTHDDPPTAEDEREAEQEMADVAAERGTAG